MYSKCLNVFILATLVLLSKAFGFEEAPGVMLGVTTLGLFGTGNFETNEAPQNWRETILYMYPNGDAPLTALLSMAGREGTDSSTFNWWEKGLNAYYTTFTGAQTNVATTLNVASSAFMTKGCQIFNPRTNEVMILTIDPPSGTTITVTRGAAGSTGTAINDADHLFLIGTVYSEGEGVNNPIYTGPSNKYNYCQIFKRPVEITKSAEKETTRTGNKYEDMKEEALRAYSIDMEMAYLFGRRFSDTGSNSKPRRWTGGLDTHFITTNRFDASGTMTRTTFNNWMEQLFAYGSEERLLLAGRSFIRFIHEMVQLNTQYQIQGEKLYGIKLQRIVTPYGDLLLKRHPLFSANSYLRQYGIALDIPNIKERTFRDTDFLENIQLPDADEKKDAFISETGLEVNHENTHAIFENIGAYTNT